MIRVGTILIGVCLFGLIAAWASRDKGLETFKQEIAGWHTRCDHPSDLRRCQDELRALTLRAERNGWRGLYSVY